MSFEIFNVSDEEWTEQSNNLIQLGVDLNSCSVGSNCQSVIEQGALKGLSYSQVSVAIYNSVYGDMSDWIFHPENDSRRQKLLSIAGDLYGEESVDKAVLQNGFIQKTADELQYCWTNQKVTDPALKENPPLSCKSLLMSVKWVWSLSLPQVLQAVELAEVALQDRLSSEGAHWFGLFHQHSGYGGGGSRGGRAYP